MILYKRMRVVVMLLTVAVLNSAVADTSEGSYLFSISKPGYAKSYLFGTIHLPDKRVTKLPDNVMTAYRSADGVYTEVAMEPEEVMASAQAMLFNDGRTLVDILPPDTMAAFERELQAINPGFKASAFMTMKVWAAATALIMMETQMENPGVNPMDMAIYIGAKKGGRRVGGLEEMQEQIDIFESFTLEEQIQMMDALLEQMRDMRENGVSYIDEMVDAYLTGDLKTLEEMMASYATEDQALQAKFEKLFLENRNVLMAERIAKIMAQYPDETEFFAIGAAHLYGDDGVPALLREAGFDVQRAP